MKVSWLFADAKISIGNIIYQEETIPQNPAARQIPELCVPETNSAAAIFKPEEPGIPEHIKIDKSNILVIGPTGVGKTYILE